MFFCVWCYVLFILPLLCVPVIPCGTLIWCWRIWIWGSILLMEEILEVGGLSHYLQGFITLLVTGVASFAWFQSIWFAASTLNSAQVGLSGFAFHGLLGAFQCTAVFCLEENCWLGCPRKIGSMVSKWVISPQYFPFISRSTCHHTRWAPTSYNWIYWAPVSRVFTTVTHL